MHAYVINLDRCPERLAHMQAQAEREGFTLTRFRAVDGCDSQRLWAADLAGYFINCPLSNGEIGCTASHLILARIIANSGEPALILEDDVQLFGGFGRALEEILANAPAGWDMIRLSASMKRAEWPVAAAGADRSFTRYSKIPMGTHGYLLSPAGARKLLTARVCTEAIDVEISRPWILGLDVYGVSPGILRVAEMGSTIPKRTRPQHMSRLALIRQSLKEMGAVGFLSCLAWNMVGRKIGIKKPQARAWG
jgi:glycosyl transferase family 25